MRFAEFDELMVAYRQHHGSVLASGWWAAHALHTVFFIGLGHVDPWVVYVDLGVVALECLHNVDDLGVAHIRAVFLEGQAQYQHFAAQHGQAFSQHELDGFVCHMVGHAVIDASAGQDDFRVVADFLGLVREVVGVNADAVAAHQAGAEGQEVPLGASSLQHFQRVDTQFVKNQAEFVHQGDVDIALGVFNDLRGLGHLDAAGLVGASGDDLGVELVNGGGNLGGGAARDLLDGRQAVLFVTGVDALRAVAAEEVLVELEPAESFQHRDADLFGGTRVNGGLVDHHVARLEYPAHGFAGFDERGHVGAVGFVDGRWHRDDEDFRLLEPLGVAAVTQMRGRLQFVWAAFKGVVQARLQLSDACGVDVEPHDGTVLAEFNGQGQANVAEADDGDGFVLEVHVLLLS